MTRFTSSTGLRRTAATVAAIAAATVAFTTVAAPADAKAHEPSRGKVWNAVAKCESSRHWHIHSGNGYYGGLQFDRHTWNSHGGKKYASRADRATRREQIAVARRVLHDQGPGAWPVCSKKAHLTRDSGDATGKKLPKHA